MCSELWIAIIVMLGICVLMGLFWKVWDEKIMPAFQQVKPHSGATLMGIPVNNGSGALVAIPAGAELQSRVSVDVEQIRPILVKALVKPIKKYGKAYEAAETAEECLKLMDPERIMGKAIKSVEKVGMMLIESGCPGSQLMDYLEPLAVAVDEYAPLYHQVVKRWEGQFYEGGAAGRKGAEICGQIGRVFGNWGEIGGMVVGALLAGSHVGKQIEADFRQLEGEFSSIGMMWEECIVRVGERAEEMWIAQATTGGQS